MRIGSMRSTFLTKQILKQNCASLKKERRRLEISLGNIFKLLYNHISGDNPFRTWIHFDSVLSLCNRQHRDLIYHSCKHKPHLKISTTHILFIAHIFNHNYILLFLFAHTIKFDVKSIYIYIYIPSRLNVSFSQCFDLVFDWLLHFLPILFCSRESRDQSPDREPSRRTRYNNDIKITNTFIITYIFSKLKCHNHGIRIFTIVT